MESQNGEVLHYASSVLGTGGANLLPTNSISWNIVIFEFQDKETIAFHPIFLVSSSSHKQRTWHKSTHATTDSMEHCECFVHTWKGNWQCSIQHWVQRYIVKAKAFQGSWITVKTSLLNATWLQHDGRIWKGVKNHALTPTHWCTSYLNGWLIYLVKGWWRESEHKSLLLQSERTESNEHLQN